VQRKCGDPGAIRTRDPQLRRLFRKSCDLPVLLRYSENLVRSGSAMRCQEVPRGDTVTSGGRGNREPAKLAMRIADEHSSSAREPALHVGDNRILPLDLTSPRRVRLARPSLFPSYAGCHMIPPSSSEMKARGRKIMNRRTIVAYIGGAASAAASDGCRPTERFQTLHPAGGRA